MRLNPHLYDALYEDSHGFMYGNPTSYDLISMGAAHKAGEMVNLGLIVNTHNNF